MSEVLAAVRFVLYGRPISKNEMYLHAPNVPGGAKILTADARAYMGRVKRTALYALRGSGWPDNLCAPRIVRLTIQIYGSRHDSGAADAIIRDALEGVLYRNDSCVEIGAQARPPKAHEPYVDVRADLLEVWPAKEASRRLRDALTRDARTGGHAIP